MNNEICDQKSDSLTKLGTVRNFDFLFCLDRKCTGFCYLICIIMLYIFFTQVLWHYSSIHLPDRWVSVTYVLIYYPQLGYRCVSLVCVMVRKKPALKCCIASSILNLCPKYPPRSKLWRSKEKLSFLRSLFTVLWPDVNICICIWIPPLKK